LTITKPEKNSSRAFRLQKNIYQNRIDDYFLIGGVSSALLANAIKASILSSASIGSLLGMLLHGYLNFSE
jgi:hypothetical protein